MRNKLVKTYVLRLEAIDPLNEQHPYVRQDVPYMFERPGDTEIRDQLRDMATRHPDAHVKATIVEEYSLSEQ